MIYKIEYNTQVYTDIKKIPKNFLPTLRDAIESRLSTRPYDFNSLKGKKYHGLFRLRVGDYRIIYSILEEEKIVKIHCIGIRSNVYKILEKKL